MANILELLMGTQPQAEAEQYPALSKAVGFNMMDEVKKPDPITKKLDKNKEGSLVAQAQKQMATPRAPSRVVSNAQNQMATQNVSNVTEDLGLGNDETTTELNNIITALKEKMTKTPEQVGEDKRNQLLYQVGALFTKNPLLTQLAGRQVASADEVNQGLQGKLMEALKAKAGIKKDEDARAAELYRNQLTDKYYKQMGANAMGIKDYELNARLENKMSDEISKIIKPLSEAQQKFQTIKQGFASGDYQTMMNQLSNFSRFVSGEKGVLTDQDIARVLPRSKITDWSKLQAYFRDTPTAKIPPEFTQKLIDLTNIAEQKTIEKYKKDFKQKKSGWTSPTSVYKRIEGPASDLIKNVETDYFPENTVEAPTDPTDLLGGNAAAEWLKKKRGSK